MPAVPPRPGLIPQPPTAALFASVLIAFGSVVTCPSAWAAVYTVTKTDDTNDEACTVDDCSLREAIRAANASPGRDTVLVPEGTYLMRIEGRGEQEAATGDLDISDSLELLGAGQDSTIVDAQRIDRVFETSGDDSVEISGLTIQGGWDYRSTFWGGGGVLAWGYGGLGSLAIRNCTVRANEVQYSGGGIASLGNLTLVSSLVTENIAEDDGGGIYNYGTMTIVDSTIEGNRAGNGGGISNAGYGSELTITGSSVVRNVARGGAGIYNAQSDWISVSNSTISENVAEGGTGGILNMRWLYLTNTTVAGNRSNGGTAGISNYSLKADMRASARFTNVLIANDCSYHSAYSFSNGGNIESPGNTCELDHATDQVDVVDPGIGPLAWNGGPTETHALLPGSPAIDRGREADCPSSDQRGAYRPSGTACDVGAYERSFLDGAADYGGDGSDEIGVFRSGMWYLSDSPDYAGVDRVLAFGSPTPSMDRPNVGEFGCAAGGLPDGMTDLVTFRKPFSTWQVALSPNWPGTPDLALTHGTTSHKPLSTRWLDTNGDGCSDIGVFRDGCFSVLESPGYGPPSKTICFGPGTDEPLAGDLDADGKSDLILWRASSAHYTYRLSSEAYSSDHATDLGAGEISVLAELNGDRRLDLGSYEGSTSTARFSFSPDFGQVDWVKTHGLAGDIPIFADVNGDALSDIGVFRAAVGGWYFACSPGWDASCLSRSFGKAGDLPIYEAPPGMWPR